MKNVPWTKALLEEFIEQGLLSDLEVRVLKRIVRKESRTQISNELNISPATLDRTIKNLKNRYDAVAEYDAKLPKRK